MRYIDRFARTLAFALLFIAWTDGDSAEFVAPLEDGWHAWQVEASEGGVNRCCYRSSDGDVSMQGCDLDGRGGHAIHHGDCDLDSKRLNVYVHMQGGKATRIRALNADCPVATRDALTELGSVDGQASVRWLLQQVDPNGDESRTSEDAMAAISAHSSKVSLGALTSILEDRERRRKTREQALFWLAQTNADEAFDYIDALLSRT
jgi:hypothetical protein